MVVMLDPGHGVETPGKRSPDGRLREWEYNRRVARAVAARLAAAGVESRLTVDGDADMSLRERCRRVNDVCRARGKDSVLLVSIHCNAAGADGSWHSARGWSVFVAPGASAASRRLASALAVSSEAQGLAVRRPSPGTDFWTASLAVCRDTLCPAVLTENLFMDNRTDVDYLTSEAGFRSIVALHVDGVLSYLNKL